MGELYHEKQAAALCAVHCCNTLLQGPYFTEVDFAQIAADLDAKERAMMAEAGMESADFLKFVAEDSANVAADGMFSIQVISKALEVWGLEAVPLENPRASTAKASPLSQTGFICHLQEHWFTVRKVKARWYNFNSLFPAPMPLSDLYIEAFLEQLRTEGWSIFWVTGSFPGKGHSMASGGGGGQWMSHEEAERLSKGAEAARQAGATRASAEMAMAMADRMQGRTLALGGGGRGGGGEYDTDLERALAASMGDGGPTTAGRGVDDDLEAAIAASLADAGGGQGAARLPPTMAAGGGADGDLQRAMALSLQDSAPRPAPAKPMGPEPSAGVGVVQLAFRTPAGGGRPTRRFDSNAPGGVGSVLEFLASQGLDPSKYQVVTSFPRAVLADEGRSLASVGVTDSCLLIVEPRR